MADSCSAASSLLVISTAGVAQRSVAAELRLAAGRLRYANALNETGWESSTATKCCALSFLTKCVRPQQLRVFDISSHKLGGVWLLMLLELLGSLGGSRAAAPKPLVLFLLAG